MAFGVSPAAAQSAQGNAKANANIIKRLSFVKTEDLDFGRIIASNTAGTVRIEPNGNRTATGGVTLIGTNEHKAAGYAGMGAYNQNVLISVSANSIWITGPGAPMRVSQFEIGSTPTAILTTNPRVFRIAGPTGIFEFPVGATLDVNASQAPGVYSGTYTITLNYM